MCPVYPVENRETGERKELTLSLREWEEFKLNNPDWFRFFTPENSPGLGVEQTGEWKDKLNKKHPSWKEVLNKVKAGPGKKAKDLY